MAALYKALAPLGFTPRQVDELEMWECAVILGVEADSGSDLISQRLAAARGEAPPPDVPPTPDAVILSLPRT
jgi:hypothetical protein